MVRRQVGPGVGLSVDANQAYGPKDFLPVMLALEKYSVDLIEQPVKAHDWDGLKFLTDRSQAIIEGDECARSLKDILDLLSMNACDSFNLKVMRLGGLRNVQTAARLCEVAGRRYRVGTAFGPRLIAAQSAPLSISLPRLSYPLEFAEFEHFLNDPYEGLETTGGMLEITDAIGSGVRRKSGIGDR
jgi:L-alanine-DL-glutamate epimerase-like enolase superfamily enzyme